MSNEKDNTPVFEEIERKMKYGAPELQKFYQKYLTKGLIFAIILHLILVSGYAFALYMDKVRSEKDKDEMQKREITLEDLDIPPPIEDIPIEEPKAVALKDLSALVPERPLPAVAGVFSGAVRTPQRRRVPGGLPPSLHAGQVREPGIWPSPPGAGHAGNPAAAP